MQQPLNHCCRKMIAENSRPPQGLMTSQVVE
ncbi:unnamed protein product, partial [Vitis vinifera]|uniref:Uncharacterized protein n=1 Tax=Vitis vinifera TaxID=29760 RepID=D7TBZ0_VITVI